VVVAIILAPIGGLVLIGVIIFVIIKFSKTKKTDEPQTQGNATNLGKVNEDLAND